MALGRWSLPIFVAAAALALAGQFLVLLAAARGKTPSSSQTLGARAREMVWIVVPALALVAVLIAAWGAIAEARTRPAAVQTSDPSQPAPRREGVA